MIRPQNIARRLYRRSRTRRAGREERRFHSSLTFDPQAPSLLLSPHLDDAVLDCWSILASDDEVTVINVFAGIPREGVLTLWDSITGASDSAERARARIREDSLALARANREPVNLSFLDSQYRRPPSPTLAQLDLAIGEHVPRARRVLVPAGLGSHPDHLLTRRVGRMLHRAGMPVTLYADLPYCLLHGWPHWVDGREPEPFRNVDAFWGSFLQDVPEMPQLRDARVVKLDEQAATAKLEAMRAYETQFPALSYGARGLLSDRAIHGFEVSWDLT